MRIYSTGLKSALLAGVVAYLIGCSGSMSPSGSIQPADSPRTAPTPTPSAKAIYVSTFGSVAAYPHDNQKNAPPICTVPYATGTLGIDVDRAGNLITPGYVGSKRAIVVGAGPGICGPELGSVVDPYGILEDVASNNAATGKIAALNSLDNGQCGSAPCGGSISVCTLASGCTTNLTNPAIYLAYGVAMDRKGDCWASAENPNGAGTLTYFAGCSGNGVAATGFVNPTGGGLDLDTHGNILAVARLYNASLSALYVYNGCKPACTLVSGPWLLDNECCGVWGHLNRLGNLYAIPNTFYGRVDVYAYTPTSLHFKYSFNNGVSKYVGGTAFIPAER